MFWFMSRWTAWGRKISPSAAIAVSLAVLAVAVSLFFIKGFQKGPRQGAAPFEELEREEALSRALEESARVTLSERILEKRPDVQKVEFHKVWTEKTEDPNMRRIFFSYTITSKSQNPDDQSAAGAFSVKSQALLKRKSSQSGDWLLSNYQAKTSALDFSEPLLLKAPSPSAAPAAAAKAAQQASSPPKEPAKAVSPSEPGPSPPSAAPSP